MTDDRSLERAARSWIEEGPTRAPDRPVEAALHAIDATPQERDLRIPWKLTGRHPLTRLAMMALVAVVVVAAVLSLRPSSNIGGLPSPSPTSGRASPSPSIDPTPSSSAAIATRPPNLFTVAPLVPASPLPDPAGTSLPDELIDRTYVSDPPVIQDTQVENMTLRAADDPNCMAMYAGRSTCFTLLWEPNYPKHITDPGVRGPARIVDGKLVLGWALVPFDPECEGTSATYAIEAGGATLTATDVPACSYQRFREKQPSS